MFKDVVYLCNVPSELILQYVLGHFASISDELRLNQPNS